MTQDKRSFTDNYITNIIKRNDKLTNYKESTPTITPNHENQQIENAQTIRNVNANCSAKMRLFSAFETYMSCSLCVSVCECVRVCVCVCVCE